MIDTDLAVLAVARTVTASAWIERPSGFATKTPCLVITPMVGRGSGHGLHEVYDYRAEAWASSRAAAKSLANEFRGALREAWLLPSGPLNTATTRQLPFPQRSGVDGLWRFDLDFSASTRVHA